MSPTINVLPQAAGQVLSRRKAHICDRLAGKRAFLSVIDQNLCVCPPQTHRLSPPAQRDGLFAVTQTATVRRIVVEDAEDMATRSVAVVTGIECVVVIDGNRRHRVAESDGEAR